MTERTAPQPRFLPEEIGSTSASRREFGQSLLHGSGQEGHLDPNSFNFLDFRNPRMRRRAQQLGFENGRVYLNPTTYAFLLAAHDDGAIERVRLSSQAESFSRFIEVNWLYAFTDASSKDIAGNYGYSSRFTPSLILRRFYRRFYNAGTESLKESFELEEIKASKNRVTSRARDNISEGRGGKKPEVRRLISLGISDSKVISEMTGLTLEEIYAIRKKFRKEKFLPPSKLSRSLAIIREIESAESYDDFARLLRASSPNLLRRSRVFTSIGQFLINSGYTNSKETREKLRNYLIFEDFPIKGVDKLKLGQNGKRTFYRSYFFVTRQESEIKRLIEENLPLKKLLSGKSYANELVLQLAGPQIQDTPTVLDLIRRDKWVSVGPLLRRMKISVDDLDLSFPVYLYRTSTILVPTESYEDLLRIIGNKTGWGEARG